ncbi:MAG TPA: hypothetical protein VFH80_22130 [Solirubrobacteraceae bacterium]|nr:hypothetical protein [Solirubrobacteraceae bacterium]
MKLLVEGGDAVALPDEVVDGADLWAAGVVLWTAGFALCAAGFTLALALAAAAAAAAARVAVVAEVLVVVGAGAVGAGVVAAGDGVGNAVRLDPAGFGELPEPPVNTSASSTSAIRPRTIRVHLRAPNPAGNSRRLRRGRDAAPIRAATPARSAPPTRLAARLRARGPTGASPSGRFGRSPRRMARADGREDLVVPRLGRADRGGPDAWLIGVPAIKPFPAPPSAGSGWGVG